MTPEQKHEARILAQQIQKIMISAALNLPNLDAAPDILGTAFADSLDLVSDSLGTGVAERVMERCDALRAMLPAKTEVHHG